MNAQLKPITERAIEPATYDNRNLQMAGLWVRDNLEALKARYETLGKAISEHHADAFLGFAACQWDTERLRQ